MGKHVPTRGFPIVQPSCEAAVIVREREYI